MIIGIIDNIYSLILLNLNQKSILKDFFFLLILYFSIPTMKNYIYIYIFIKRINLNNDNWNN